MVGWQEKKVLSKVPLSDFFTGVQRFAGQVAQKYGEVDKSLGGWLPGGADNPYIGKSTPYFSRPPARSNFLNAPGKVVPAFSPPPSPFEKDLGRAVNTGATAIANVQPVVKNLVTGSPDFVQNAVSTGLNSLPISANFFGRYYTGLGNKGLELPTSFINDARTALQENAPKTPIALKSLQDAEPREQNNLNDLRQGNIPSQYKYMLSGMNKEDVKTALYQEINNSLAENRSNQKQFRAGYVPIVADQFGGGSRNPNPLTSLGTSLGSAWFKPTSEGGWTAKDKYDFEYARADKNQPLEVSREETISPSQNFSNLAAFQFLNQFNQNQKPRPDATASPAAMFGRAIVAKMNPTSFDYNINIPPR